MPRFGTKDAHAELAVELYKNLLSERGYQVDRAWLCIAILLVTCEVWRSGEWLPLYGAPVLMESNNYKLLRDNRPNAHLSEAFQVRRRIAEALGVSEMSVCEELGQFFLHPELNGLQPNNPRGHAFRSMVAETISHFGDPGLEVVEESSPHELFPGFDFSNRSRKARIDIVVKRGPRPVALVTTRWTYRHDRVDIIDEARAYMPAARQVNGNCRFFGVTAEFGTARLKKVIDETVPSAPNAAIERLVHLNPELPGALIGKNGDLKMMWSLAQLVKDSFNWR